MRKLLLRAEIWLDDHYQLICYVLLGIVAAYLTFEILGYV